MIRQAAVREVARTLSPLGWGALIALGLVAAGAVLLLKG